MGLLSMLIAGGSVITIAMLDEEHINHNLAKVIMIGGVIVGLGLLIYDVGLITSLW